MSSTSPAPGDRAVQFGPNEWLVEEMYEKFIVDPSTVDPAWHDFFVDYKSAPQGEQFRNGRPGDSSSGDEFAAQDDPPKGASGTARTAAPAAPPVTSVPEMRPTPAEQDGASADRDTRAEAPAAVGGDSTPLRGAAARVVANMEASLGLPTATSVRAVPAKLLADNRIVINNHLARTRGGKISFTHLVGFAVVRALAEHPQMNRYFATDDQGKPAVVTPEHVNLGLAIDLKTEKGRNLVVASIKGCEVMSQIRLPHVDMVPSSPGRPAPSSSVVTSKPPLPGCRGPSGLRGCMPWNTRSVNRCASCPVWRPQIPVCTRSASVRVPAFKLAASPACLLLDVDVLKLHVVGENPGLELAEDESTAWRMFARASTRSDSGWKGNTCGTPPYLLWFPGWLIYNTRAEGLTALGFRELGSDRCRGRRARAELGPQREPSGSCEPEHRRSPRRPPQERASAQQRLLR